MIEMMSNLRIEMLLENTEDYSTQNAVWKHENETHFHVIISSNSSRYLSCKISYYLSLTTPFNDNDRDSCKCNRCKAAPVHHIWQNCETL